ncbi:MAG: type II secretion system F family protein [Rhizobiales bacterium]|nr:type II secretion system F family protein [Hyphomicrobiales bacterium]
MFDTLRDVLLGLGQAAISGWMWVGAPVVAVTLGLFLADVIGRRREIRRRAAMAEVKRGGAPQTSGGRRRLDGLVRSIDGNLGERDEQAVKVLRAKLQRAGLFDPRAVSWFFAARLCAAVCLAAVAYLVAPMIAEQIGSLALTEVVVGALGLGYFVPLLALDRLIRRRQAEYRQGFPDVMDLMIVCAQAGLSMEAGLARIAKEIELGYPRLAANLQMATLEIRGGKTLSKAIESMAHRLGVEEALSFANLLQQSEEIGASLSQSLRAYSDDMRNKRMMKAEEKAQSLPAKLVVPLMLFIFPVLLVVIALPGYLAVYRTF